MAVRSAPKLSPRVFRHVSLRAVCRVLGRDRSFSNIRCASRMVRALDTRVFVLVGEFGRRGCVGVSPIRGRIVGRAGRCATTQFVYQGVRDNFRLRIPSSRTYCLTACLLNTGVDSCSARRLRGRSLSVLGSVTMEVISSFRGCTYMFFRGQGRLRQGLLVRLGPTCFQVGCKVRLRGPLSGSMRRSCRSLFVLAGGIIRRFRCILNGGMSSSRTTCVTVRFKK